MTGEWSGPELKALEGFLRDRDLCAGPLTATRIGDGHSNLTDLVSDGATRLIVRRPPPPPIPPGAHDVLREARLVAALAGTGVPVPAVLATAQAGEVVESPLAVTSFVAGPVVTTVTPPALASARRAVGESLVDTLAALHAVDRHAAGLADLGRPEGFNLRHLRRMRRLVADEAGVLPAEFRPVDTWLEEHAPSESGASTTTTGWATSSSARSHRDAWPPCWTGSSRHSATRCSTSVTSWPRTRSRGSR
jgi:aminoglycoside phosphotransferase (APT) family kinase protein